MKIKENIFENRIGTTKYSNRRFTHINEWVKYTRKIDRKRRFLILF